MKDIIGKRFNSWIVERKSNSDNSRSKYFYLCKCDCGNEKEVYYYDLIGNRSKCCGCVGNKKTTDRNFKHGYSKSRICRIFYGIIQRCYDEKYKQYKDWGGRGIKVCDEWLNDPKAFIEWSLKNGYKSHLTIDRKDNNGDYSPNNCRWITREEQNQNTSFNVLDKYKVNRIREFYSVGILKSELVKMFNCSKSTIDRVINYKTWKNIKSYEKKYDFIIDKFKIYDKCIL